jgi:hypothetical protein
VREREKLDRQGRVERGKEGMERDGKRER